MRYTTKSPLWSTVDVQGWESAETEESLGTKEKFWVLDPERRRWLFKYARVRDGVVRGEDWAEWVVHHLGALLGTPTVEVRPAVRGDKRGIVSRSVVPEGQRLEHGNELLVRAEARYDRTAKRLNPGYTAEAVQAALDGVLPPEGWAELQSFSGFDVWTGYVVLDAWVAGRDRHHENWASVTDGARRWLYPSFDHGNALGFAESADKRLSCAVDEQRLLAWARRGRSHHFAGKPTLVEIAQQSLSLAGSDAAAFWRNRLREVTPSAIEDVLAAVPGGILSDAARTFCLRLLELNRRRVLDGD